MMAMQDSRMILGGLTLDKVRAQAHLRGRAVKLTRTEFLLLWTLAVKAGTVAKRDELLNQVWGAEVFVEPRTVDEHIAKLRKKLRAHPGGHSWIETVRRLGYRLKKPRASSASGLNPRSR
jgi:DNA-binding response OmpR family regulator